MPPKGLKDKFACLPLTAGVYIFKDRQGKTIYVGKAKSLKKRVSSYFRRSPCLKTRALAARIADIEYIVTPSEIQAQLLEAALIKDNQPQYNVSLKDDKSFPLIRISAEEFPTVSFYRRKKRQKKDRSLCFGPYTSADLLRKALKVIRRIFGFRSCKKIPKQACLYYRLRLCPGPCIGKISAEGYREIINQIKLFLDFKYERLLVSLAAKMRLASARHDFETAARIRDQINALSAIGNGKIGVAALNEQEDLEEALQLTKAPQRIEAFDISDISGAQACGAMVSFYQGLPDKNNYRRFRIKTVEGIDDYRMLAEVVFRRYSRVIAENLPKPDLILIDGGRAHLRTAQRQISKLGLDIALASIAKGEENIYIRGRRYPLKLDADSPALNLIRRVRDEAHRFALSYHHLLRRKKVIGK